MLHIRVPQAHRGLFKLAVWGFTHYEPYTTNHSYYESIVLFCLSTLDSTVSLKGHIKEGNLTNWSDRPCSHSFLEGEIIVDPNLRPYIPQSGENPWLKYSVTSPQGIVTNFCDIVYANQDYISDLWRFNAKSGGVLWRYHQVRVLATDSYFHHMKWSSTTDNDEGLGVVTGYTRKYSLATQKYSDSKSWTKTMKRSEFLSYVPAEYSLIPTQKSFVGYSGIPTDIEAIAKYFSSYNAWLSSTLLNDFIIETEKDDIWGGLAQRAIESIRFADTNGLQFLAEARNADKAFKALIPKGLTPKAFANAYLAMQYGVNTQLRDVETYVKGAKRALQSERHAWKVTHSSTSIRPYEGVECSYYYKVVYSYYPSEILNLIRRLDEWSLLPNFTMAWDLIPFSFVVDWFADVGSLIERIDYETRSQMYRVKGVTKSRKVRRRLFAYELPEYGGCIYKDIYFVRYDRFVQRHLDVPKFGTTLPDEFNNIVELTALIVVNKK